MVVVVSLCSTHDSVFLLINFCVYIIVLKINDASLIFVIRFSFYTCSLTNLT